MCRDDYNPLKSGIQLFGKNYKNKTYFKKFQLNFTFENILFISSIRKASSITVLAINIKLFQYCTILMIDCIYNSTEYFPFVMF